MLFNSYIFLFGYLPVVLAGFFALGALGRRQLAIGWLAAMSLVFYGWWNPAYLGLLGASIAGNYMLGLGLSRLPAGGRRQGLLAGAIAVNLGLLAYFKYANFFLESVNPFLAQAIPLAAIVLPLGISFFTFTQIAYLVDAYKGVAREYNFVHYVLFVTFFPHLIAGPILHHKEMMPQFADPGIYKPQAPHLAVGAAIFILGLVKKVILADGVAKYATPAFDAAASGTALSFFEAWGGALAYSMQLYFDFSGYSDMAIGLALLFNIRLPLNFFSPYQSGSIIEFWRRWHMTLSRYLRDYLYIALGGNRKGPVRRYVNLLLTMVLGGLWHGAGWTFVVWGALHGLYLVINHGWRAIAARLGWGDGGVGGRAAARTLTFVAVVVAWVFFRAPNLPTAFAMLQGMAGLNGWKPVGTVDPAMGVWVLGLMAVAFWMPNVTQLTAGASGLLADQPGFDASRWAWRPSLGWAIALGALAGLGVLGLSQPSEFLYFQF